MSDIIYTDGHRRVRPVGTPTAGGACARYEVHYEAPDGPDYGTIYFQPDTIAACGVAGWTNEAVLAVVIDRLEGFQAGPFPCDENEDALLSLYAVLARLSARTRDRKTRGVEGKHEA